METVIETPRLRLIRLTNTEEGSQHVQWFHENWTDKDATAWSLHGPCKSLAESREWMIECLEKNDNMYYSVFEKPTSIPTEQPANLCRDANSDTLEHSTAAKDAAETKALGKHIGNVSLRAQQDGPILPPPAHSVGSSMPLNLRVMGYALFASAWGQGYATEANAALLSTYAAYCAKEKAGCLNYLEAGVDEENPGSRNVLAKLGFETVGWKDEEEAVFLAGKWRVGGYWILGKYV